METNIWVYADWIFDEEKTTLSIIEPQLIGELTASVVRNKELGLTRMEIEQIAGAFK